MHEAASNSVADDASLPLRHPGRSAEGAHDGARAGAGERLDARRLARIRWRCRRGMLENDLVLARFLASHGESLTEDDVARLDRLLELPDNELWDLIARRAEPDDPSLAPLLEVLRN
jgi:antitoxin CptB